VAPRPTRSRPACLDGGPNYSLSNDRTAWTKRSSGGLGLRCKQNTSALTRSTLSSSIRYSRVDLTSSFLIGNELPRVNDFALKPKVQIMRNLGAGPSAKSWQTILYLKLEIKPFSRLSAEYVYVFSVTHRCLSSVCRRPRGL
jgi:hypothetical protein